MSSADAQMLPCGPKGVASSGGSRAVQDRHRSPLGGGEKEIEVKVN